MLKIKLFTSNPLNVFGGFEKTLITLIDYLKQKNCDFSICKLVGEDEYLPKSADWVEPYRSTKVFILNYRVEKKPFHKLREWDGQFEIEGNQQIEQIRETDIALVISPFFVPSVSNFLKKLQSNAKIVTWFHMPLYWNLLSRNIINRLVKNHVFKMFKFFQKQLKYADFHLAISSGISEEIKTYCSAAKIVTVYNPVVTKEQLNAIPIKRSSKPIFAYVGRIDDFSKNLKFMFKALSKLKIEWKLKIIGTGPDTELLKAYSDKLMISDKIEWLGFSENPFELLRDEGVTALLLTSRFEGLPTVLIEAISYGIPVITSDSLTGAKDIVVEGVNGYFYKSNQIKDFVQKINGMATGTLVIANIEQMKRSVEKFRTDVVCDQIYKQLCSFSKQR